MRNRQFHNHQWLVLSFILNNFRGKIIFIFDLFSQSDGRSLLILLIMIDTSLHPSHLYKLKIPSLRFIILIVDTNDPIFLSTKKICFDFRLHNFKYLRKSSIKSTYLSICQTGLICFLELKFGSFLRPLIASF